MECIHTAIPPSSYLQQSRPPFVPFVWNSFASRLWLATVYFDEHFKLQTPVLALKCLRLSHAMVSYFVHHAAKPPVEIQVLPPASWTLQAKAQSFVPKLWPPNPSLVFAGYFSPQSNYYLCNTLQLLGLMPSKANCRSCSLSFTLCQMRVWKYLEATRALPAPM